MLKSQIFPFSGFGFFSTGEGTSKKIFFPKLKVIPLESFGNIFELLEDYLVKKVTTLFETFYEHSNIVMRKNIIF